jgi:hypothetical protein
LRCIRRRNGEVVIFDRLDQLPYRRLVNPISRVAAGKAKG